MLIKLGDVQKFLLLLLSTSKMGSVTDLEKLQSKVKPEILRIEVLIQRDHGSLEIDSPFNEKYGFAKSQKTRR